jgi:TonB family protein
MMKIGLALILLCALGGGMFYVWTAQSAPPVEPALDKKAAEAGAKSTPNYETYMAEMQRRIKRAWFPPKCDQSKRIVCVFKVHRNGEISKLRLTSSGSSELVDKAALKAIESASPFRPLPPGSPDDISVEFTFDYNVFQNKGGGSVRKF